MRKTKKLLGILLACMMLMSLLSIGVVAAEGDRDNPINANNKWFGNGADCFLLNTTLAEGDTDGVWYELTADAKGLLHLEHSYKTVDYIIYATVNGITYEAGSQDGVPYNRPIATYPVAVGDVITIQVIARDTTQGGSMYLNAKFITGSNDTNEMVKVKSAPSKLYVGAGQTVYFQDDSLNAEYATKYVTLAGDSVKDVTLYTAAANTTGTVITQNAFTDTDGDNVIEAKLGGSEGGAGTPAVKPAWAIENNSNENRCFVLNVVSEAHECVYDDENDADCNTCGAIREFDVPTPPCEHKYATKCDTVCTLCGEERTDAPHYPVGDYACNTLCCVCWADLTTADHVYSLDIDSSCDVCGEEREIDLPMELNGSSISEDVNGLAVLYDIQVEGMRVKNDHTADYTNATFCGMKLVTMGAVVSNNYDETGALPTLEEADGGHVIDIPVQYLWEFDKSADTASFAVRLTNIPETHKDTSIAFVPYVIVEDEDGAQHTLYVTAWTFIDSYNNCI